MSEDYDNITEKFNNIFENMEIHSNMWSVVEIFYDLESQYYNLSLNGDDIVVKKGEELISIYKFKYEIMDRYKKWLSHYESFKNKKKINYYLSCIIFHTVVGEKRTTRDFWSELIYNLKCFIAGKS